MMQPGGVLELDTVRKSKVTPSMLSAANAWSSRERRFRMAASDSLPGCAPTSRGAVLQSAWFAGAAQTVARTP